MGNEKEIRFVVKMVGNVRNDLKPFSEEINTIKKSVLSLNKVSVK